jgi:general stress protein 26
LLELNKEEKMSSIINQTVEFVEKAEAALLITINEENKPDSRLIGPFVNKVLNIYIFTLLSSKKIKQIEKNKNVSLYFQNKFENMRDYMSISLYGTAEKLEENEEKNEIIQKLELKSKGYKDWIVKDGWEKWTIIKIKTESIKYVDNRETHVPIYEEINN